MRVGRLILVVATLVTIMVFPLVVRDALRALNLPSAYAAANVLDPAGRAYQNGNFNNDDDDEDDNNENNDESDNEGEDNDNAVECYLNLNDNEPVPCDFEDNDNDVVYSPPAAAPAPAPAPGSQPAQRNCFDAGETGDLQLNLEGGSVTVRVVPPAGLPSSARIDLDDIDDMSSIPAPPSGATMLDRLVWRIDATAPCDGPGVGQLPGAVNLAIRYHVPADKSKLQIVMLENGVWEEVQTVPDPNPNNPYISATIQETGVYAVIQEP